MKFRSAFTLLLPVITCHAATITLYVVQTETPKFPPASETFKPIGVGSDGMTTYFDQVVASVYYEQQLNGGGTTFTSGGSVITRDAPIRTYTSDPLTLQGTLVADASHLVYHKSPNPTDTRFPAGNNLRCDLDGRGGGACVKEYWLSTGPTATTTYTGSAVPYYTLIAEDSNSNNNGGDKNNGASSRLAMKSMFVGWGVVAGGILFGALQVL